MTNKGRSKTALGVLAIAAPAWLAAADAVIALGRGWGSGNAVDWLIAVSSLASIVLLIVLISRPGFRARCRAHATEFILMGIVIAVSLILIEAVLRMLPPPPPVPFHHAPPNLSVRVSAKNEVPKKTFSTNSDGVRGPKFNTEATHRILCIGGSTTQCHYLDDSETWTHLLMIELGDRLPGKSVWVGATGIPGFSTPQHLKYVETNPQLTQYTHAVFLVGVNDLLHWLSLSFNRNKSEPAKIPPAPLWQRLETYRRIVAIADPPRNSLMNAADAWPLDVARRMRAESKLLDTYPSPSQALDGYQSRINAIIDRCQELSIEPVFVTQPVLWEKNLPEPVEAQLWMGRTRVEGEYMSTPALRELMNQFNAALKQTCEERNVLVVDLAFMNGSTDYFFDDCHFTTHGAEVVAGAIAETMANRKLQ